MKGTAKTAPQDASIAFLDAKLESLGKATAHLFQIVEQRNTTTQRIVKDNSDSITIGAPTNGQVKVYGDASNPAEFKKRVAAALGILDEAKLNYPEGHSAKK